MPKPSVNRRKRRFARACRYVSGNRRTARALFYRHVVEPVFGIIKQALGFRQFLLAASPRCPPSGTWSPWLQHLRRLHDSGRLEVAGAY